MNNPELIVVLLIGTTLMTAIISLQMKWYGITRWKSIIVSVFLVLTGLIGSRIWYFVENLTFRGRSFYGAVFLAPIVFFPLAIACRVPYGSMLDFCAPAGCLTLAMVKVQCLRDGCCDGVALYLDKNYNYVKFPSQLVEMGAFLIIGFLLLMLSHSLKYRKKIFLWFLVLYGSTRFFLDFLRDGREPYILGLSAGSFWSLMAFITGAIMLITVELFAKKRSNGTDK